MWVAQAPSDRSVRREAAVRDLPGFPEHLPREGLIPEKIEGDIKLHLLSFEVLAKESRDRFEVTGLLKGLREFRDDLPACIRRAGWDQIEPPQKALPGKEHDASKIGFEEAKFHRSTPN